MELYKKVYIKSEADLPKEERAMCFVGVKDNLNPEDLYEWFNYKNPVMANNQAEYWLNTFDWYLQPIEITDEDIEAWAIKKMQREVSGMLHIIDAAYVSAFMDGAKAVLNNEIKHE